MKALQRGRLARSDKRTRPSAPKAHSGIVLLLSTDAPLREQLTKLLSSDDYLVVKCGADESMTKSAREHSPDLIVIADPGSENLWVRPLRELSKSDDAIPVVVFGSAGSRKRKECIPDSVVLVRLCSEVLPEDQLSAVAAAMRYRKLQKENRLLRKEAEELCSDLLRAIGDTTEKLQKRDQEALRVEGILRDAQARILRVFS